MGDALVTGRLVIGGAAPPFRGAVAHVYLEDVTYADAPARRLADVIIPDVAHEIAANGRETVIPFRLRVEPALEAAGAYAVRAWVDRDGDGQIGAGDLCSDQAYRVLTGGYGSRVSIALNPC